MTTYIQSRTVLDVLSNPSGPYKALYEAIAQWLFEEGYLAEDVTEMLIRPDVYELYGPHETFHDIAVTLQTDHGMRELIRRWNATKHQWIGNSWGVKKIVK